MRAVTAASSADVLRLARGYEAVGVDEAQFFDPGIVGAISELVDRGVRVVAAGLAQDFRGLPLGPMPTPLAIADYVDKPEAVSPRSGGPAAPTQRRRPPQAPPLSRATGPNGAPPPPRAARPAG